MGNVTQVLTYAGAHVCTFVHVAQLQKQAESAIMAETIWFLDASTSALCSDVDASESGRSIMMRQVARPGDYNAPPHDQNGADYTGREQRRRGEEALSQAG